MSTECRLTPDVSKHDDADDHHVRGASGSKSKAISVEGTTPAMVALARKKKIADAIALMKKVVERNAAKHSSATNSNDVTLSSPFRRETTLRCHKKMKVLSEVHAKIDHLVAVVSELKNAHGSGGGEGGD